MVDCSHRLADFVTRHLLRKVCGFSVALRPSEKFLVDMLFRRIVVPWEEDELKRLLHAVKSSDIPMVAAKPRKSEIRKLEA